MQSIRECRVYSKWKVARLTPVFKKDDPTEMSNYRPLSLLNVPSKILESCVAEMIGKHVFSENEALVTDNQWAYRKGRSTELLLIHLTETWRRAIDNKLVVGALTSRRRLIAFHTQSFSTSWSTTLESRETYWHG